MRALLQVLVLGGMCAVSAAQQPAADPIVRLELRWPPGEVAPGGKVPAPRQFAVHRSQVDNLRAADPDGVHRAASFRFKLSVASAEEAARLRTRAEGVGIQFRIAASRDQDLATLVAIEQPSPLEGLRAYENRDPKAVGDLYAGKDPELGEIHATCVELMLGRQTGMCVIQAPLDSDVVILATVKSTEYSTWRDEVRRTRARVIALQER